MPTPGPTSTPPASSSSDSLLGLLAQLVVGPEDRTGYDRSLFPHWIDADGDGCDARREVLIEESLIPVAIGSGCYLSGGRWSSLYDGMITTDPGMFDIDHVVALAEAWDSGASAWSRDRRTRFANDLGVSWSLIAVSASSNRSKSDRDPADWLPPLTSVQCEYIEMWLMVKVRWELAVDQREHDQIASLADGCGG